MASKTSKESLFHLTKRVDMAVWKKWTIRIVAFALSILACAVISTILSGKDFTFFFKHFFSGAFGSERKIWVLFHETAILLLIALAITPCFKMRYWNIGAEGQVLMGALGSAVVINYLGGTVSNAVVIILSIVAAVIFSMIWSVIPALFKAKWNTNETLLTLMFNYIAICLAEYFIKSVASSGTGTLSFEYGLITGIADNEFVLKIIIVTIITVLMAIYLRYSKHGYELSVVGESENTARYIGINTKKVIIRTLLLCGLLCGICGFLLVNATNFSLHSTTTVDGRGFTAVLVSWLAHFNPLAMALTSFLVVFVDCGASQVGNYGRLGANYPSVMTGIFFFFIIATEFFINYKISIKNDGTSKFAKFINSLAPKKAATTKKEDK